MAYDVPPAEQCPEPGYAITSSMTRTGRSTTTGLGITLKMTAVPKMRSRRYTGLFYEAAYTYRNGGMFDLRPLYMFYKSATVTGVEVPRFTKITDPEVIARLDAIRAHMYPDP
jgi:hypothetical protein